MTMSGQANINFVAAPAVQCAGPIRRRSTEAKESCRTSRLWQLYLSDYILPLLSIVFLLKFSAEISQQLTQRSELQRLKNSAGSHCKMLSHVDVADYSQVSRTLGMGQKTASSFLYILYAALLLLHSDLTSGQMQLLPTEWRTGVSLDTEVCCRLASYAYAHRERLSVASLWNIPLAQAILLSSVCLVCQE